MIENDEWDIPIEEIVFYEDRQGTSSGKSQMHSFRSLKSFVSINEIEDGDEVQNRQSDTQANRHTGGQTHRFNSSNKVSMTSHE